MSASLDRLDAERYFGERVDEYFELHPSMLRNTEEGWELSFTKWLEQRREELNEEGI